MRATHSKNVAETRISAQKLHFINRALENLGLPKDEKLSALLKKRHGRDEHRQTVSLNDVTEVYERIAKIDIPALGLAIGRQISCGDYGLYGCTLLCKRSLEDTSLFSIKYHTLTTRTTRLYLTPLREDVKLYGCADILFRPQIRDFNLEMQIGINLTLIREVLGDANFAPCAVNFEFSKPRYVKQLQEFTQCEVRFDQEYTGVELSHDNLALPPVKSNPLAIPLLLKICDEHKPDFAHQSEVVERVYNWVSQNIHNELKIEKIAHQLCVSERTLRRKLSDNGTSFTEICLAIKQGFAKKYISDTQLSFDDISESLGFKDTSNFRHAFKGWTGMTPTEFRQARQRK